MGNLTGLGAGYLCVERSILNSKFPLPFVHNPFCKCEHVYTVTGNPKSVCVLLLPYLRQRWRMRRVCLAPAGHGYLVCLQHCRASLTWTCSSYRPGLGAEDVLITFLHAGLAPVCCLITLCPFLLREISPGAQWDIISRESETGLRPIYCSALSVWPILRWGISWYRARQHIQVCAVSSQFSLLLLPVIVCHSPFLLLAVWTFHQQLCLLLLFD